MEKRISEFIGMIALPCFYFRGAWISSRVLTIKGFTTTFEILLPKQYSSLDLLNLFIEKVKTKNFDPIEKKDWLETLNKIKNGQNKFNNNPQ